MKFKISGIVYEKESRKPVPELLVRAFDKDLIYTDLLGNAETKPDGTFVIGYEGKDFQELFDKSPDIYLDIYGRATAKDPGRAGDKPIFTTKGSVRFNAGRSEHFTIEIPRKQLGADAPTMEKVQLRGDGGELQTEFEPGDVLMVGMTGLKPEGLVTVCVRDDKDNVVRDEVLKITKEGVLDSTAIWPNLGVIGKHAPPYAFKTHEEAVKKLGGRKFRVQILEDGRLVQEASFTIPTRLTRPIVFPVKKEGYFTTGFQQGTQDLIIQGMNISHGTQARVFLVPRQWGWRIGDPIQPVRNSAGSLITVDLRQDSGRISGTLWSAAETRVGAYDIIVRPFTPGQAELAEMYLQVTDIVTNRFVTTLVIRDDIFKHKSVWLGCVNTQEIAGTSIPERPYYRYLSNFPVGTPVYASLDPAGLASEQVGKKVAYYVIEHKPEADWATNSDLIDVSGPGGAPQIAKITLVDDCINHNKKLVWANPQKGKYDLVADFGNNDSDTSQFQEDDSFDPPVDMIDGYFVVGFHVTEDPATSSTYPYIGSGVYALPALNIPSPPFWDDEPDEPQYEDPITGEYILPYPLDAIIRYPAETDGTTVSTAKTKYPVIVCVHGQHNWQDPNHEGYIYLLEHLASNGFIAVSINQHKMNQYRVFTDVRARGILAHLDVLAQLNTDPSLLEGKFVGKLDLDNIGLMGHSRGGDAVVMTQIFNEKEDLGWNIKAIVSISPTDFTGTHPDPAERIALTQTPYLMIYGSNDGDVAGWAGPEGFTGTGFRIYDRATSEKTALYVRKGTHNRFNSVWGTEGSIDLSNPNNVLSSDLHELVAKGYMTAFFQRHLMQGYEHQVAYLNGEIQPPSVASVEIDTQYFNPLRLTLDNFEPAPNYILDKNSLDGDVSWDNLDEIDENKMAILDPKTAHQTSGGKVKWTNTSARYRSSIPAGSGDVSVYKEMTLRVARHFGSTWNLADQFQDFYITLKSGDPNDVSTHNKRAIRVGAFVPIRSNYDSHITQSYIDWYGDPDKSVFTTIRIPLTSWNIKCMSAEIVDLTNVYEVEFEFRAKLTGELEVDSIAFSE